MRSAWLNAFLLVAPFDGGRSCASTRRRWCMRTARRVQRRDADRGAALEEEDSASVSGMLLQCWLRAIFCSMAPYSSPFIAPCSPQQSVGRGGTATRVATRSTGAHTTHDILATSSAAMVIALIWRASLLLVTRRAVRVYCEWCRCCRRRSQRQHCAQPPRGDADLAACCARVGLRAA